MRDALARVLDVALQFLALAASLGVLAAALYLLAE